LVASFTGKIATCFRRCRWVVDYKVIPRVPISSNLMSSKNLTSSNNAANQINLNYSIHATEVESLLGKTFEMRGQPLQCIWLLPIICYNLCCYILALHIPCTCSLLYFYTLQYYVLTLDQFYVFVYYVVFR
jgi:hypothetical protein